MLRRTLEKAVQAAAQQAHLGGRIAAFETSGAARPTRIVQGLLGWDPTCSRMQHTSSSAGQEGEAQAAAEPEAPPATQPPAAPQQRQHGPHPRGARQQQQRRQQEYQQLKSTPQQYSGAGARGEQPGGGKLYAQLEALTTAGDPQGARRVFDAALASAKREMAAAKSATPPPALASQANWALYLQALGQSNAHPLFIATRLQTMQDFGLKPQVDAYTILLQRCAEGSMGTLAHSKVVEMRNKGLSPTMDCFLSAIAACLKSEQPGYAKRLFELRKAVRPEWTGQQRTTFGKLSIFAIREFAKWGRFSYCFDLMDDMEKLSLTVPAFLLTDVMHAAAEAGRADALNECVARLSLVKQGFQVTQDPASKIARPIKMDEGSLQEVLGVAAQKGDAQLAAATWELLLRSLSLPNPPNFPNYAYKSEDEGEGEGPEAGAGVAEAGAADGAAASGAGSSTAGGAAAEAAAAAEGAAAAAAGAAEAAEGTGGSGTGVAEVYEAAALAAHKPRLPQVSSYQALIQAYANAHDFARMFQAIRELEKAHPPAPGTAAPVAYHNGLQPAVDALSHSTRFIDAAFYQLEDMAKAGEEVTAAMLNVVVAACSQVGDIKRGLETFDAFPSLGVEPDADTFNALLQGCIECGMLSTGDKVVEEMLSQQVAPNGQTYHLMVERCIVSADVEGMMRSLRVLEDAGHSPKTRLLERCVARCEREGDGENLKLLLDRLFANDYRIVGIDAMTKRWIPEGGMPMLTGSSNWVNREDYVGDIPSLAGRYQRPGWQSRSTRGSGRHRS